MKKDYVRAPAELEPKTADWYRQVVRGWQLDQHHLHLLRLACQAFDQSQRARKILDDMGDTFEDRYGQPKPRPEVKILQDSRIAFARLLRELDLDISDESSDRPPSLRRFR